MDRKNLLLDGRTVENKGKLSLLEYPDFKITQTSPLGVKFKKNNFRQNSKKAIEMKSALL